MDETTGVRREQQRGRDTRERVLVAAAAEFSENGVAGARINRIAADARASKERIYAWFGDKESLFDRVMQRGLEDIAQAVPIEVDLVDYTVRLHDHFTAHPESQRVATWAWIHESRHPAPSSRLAAYQHKIDVIERAQRDGLADPTWAPTTLLALLLTTATAWLMAPTEIHQIAGVDDEGAAARRRGEVALAAQRILEPHRG